MPADFETGGTAAPRYQLLAEIGRGQRAVVFAADDTLLGRRVAVKQALPQNEASLLEEARRLARVHSPHVVQLFDVLHAPRTALVLEQLQGTNLRDVLEPGRPWPLQRAAPLVDQLLETLAAAHAAGVVHGDLKPENAWLLPAGDLKLLDLGAPPCPGGDHTALYSAPEVDLGGAPSPRSDLYAVGVMAFELLCGRLPFEAAQAAELAVRKSTTVPPAARSSGALVPPEVEAWLSCALQADPARRFGTTETALRAWREASAASSFSTALAAPSAAFVLHPEAWERLQYLLRELRAGRGGCVLLAGEPGMGASTLLGQCAGAASEADLRVLQVSMPAHLPHRTFAAWRAGLLAAGQFLPESRALLPSTRRMAPGFETRFQERVEGAFSALDGAPPVLLVDDLARIDPASRRLALRLAGRAQALRLAVVLVVPHGGAEAQARRVQRLVSHLAADRCVLTPPTGERWRSFVATRLGSSTPSDALLAHLEERGAHDPRVTVLLLESLRASGALRFSEEVWVFRPERARGDSFPAAATDHVERRLRGLGASRRELLRDAALQGATFQASPLARLRGQTEPEVLQALHEIELDTGLVHREGDTHRFVQPMVAACLRARQCPETARREHARLAAALLACGAADGPVGEHLFLSGDESAALPHLERAARGALADHEAGRALRWLDFACRALEAQSEDETQATQRVQIGMLRAQALQLVAAWDDAVGELENAAILAQAWGLGSAEVQARRALGEIEYRRSRFDDAVRRYETAQACAARLGDEHELHELALKTGNIHFERGELESAAREYERVLAYATADADPDLEARAANNVAMVESIQGRKERAVQFYNRSLERFRAAGRDDAVARLYQNIGMIYLELGNWAEARNFFSSAMQQSEANAEDEMLAVASLDYAEATLRLGQPEAARAPVERALASCRERGDELGVATAHRLQASLAAADGDIALAESRLQQSIDLLEKLGQPLQLGLCWKELGAIRLAARRPRAAQALQEAQRLFRGLDAAQHAAEVEALLGRCREGPACHN